MMKTTDFPRHISVILLLSVLLMAAAEIMAQTYSVESFRRLPNDVSAFIEPIKDLNGEDCALVKVEAPAEFVFSSPLGIVKRLDNVGEIWLYMPKGSKRLTFKHPEWGVLRNYSFPERLESHMTYEIRLNLPEISRVAIALPPDTVFTTLRDTLIVVRTDTLRVPDTPRFRPRLALRVLPTLGFGGASGTLSVTGGLRLMLVKRHGGYLHLSTDFGRLGKTIGVCDREGYIGDRLPFYSSRSRHSFMVATAGGAHLLNKHVGIFEGLGYGYDRTAWELAPSEGGGFVRNGGLSVGTVAIEAGAMYTRRRLTVSCSLLTLGGRRWLGMVGIGLVI